MVYGKELEYGVHILHWMIENNKPEEILHQTKVILLLFIAWNLTHIPSFVL